MAFVHGKDTKIYINQNDYSQYFNSADTSMTADVAETTTFGVTGDAKTYIGGQKDGTSSLAGFFDATSDAVLQPLLGGNDFVFVNGASGVSATDKVFFANANITNYGVSSPVGDVVATSLEIQADGGMLNGLILENDTITATADGTARDNGSSTTNGGGAFLLVTSASGTTPTLDVVIKHSADDITYTNLVTFTQATTSTSEYKSVAKGTTVNRYLKVSFTVSGTTPSFSAIVGFGRIN
jgi:hypothetical protein